MTFLAYGLFCLGLTVLGFWRRDFIWILLLAALAWFGFGFYGTSGNALGTVLHTFGLVGWLFGLAIFLAVPVMMLGERRKRRIAIKEKMDAEGEQDDYERELDIIYGEE